MQLKFFVLLAACSLTWGMQNFVSFEHDVIQSFLNGLRTRFAVPGNFIPGIENTVPAGQPPQCNCPDDKPLNAVGNNANNNNNNNNNNNIFGSRTQPAAPAPKASAPDQGPYANRANQASGNYPPILVQNNNNQNNNNNLNNNKNNANNYNGKLKESLSTNLLQAIAPHMPHQNIIYSPLSLELLLTFVCLGAKGQTANELLQVLKLPANKQQIISQASAKIPKQQNSKGAQISMANKMYYAKNLVPENNISNAAMMLQTEFEATNFSPPEQAAANINNWVAWKTQNRIQNLIGPQELEPTTESILVNAIHFKAQWDKEFSTSDTEINDFQNSDGQIVKADMMYNEDLFRYGEFPNLGAKVIELPYNDSAISMMIILPYDTYGISNVEKQMENVNLAEISQQLKPRTVTLRLPKFRFDCELNMVPALMQLGIQELFFNNADLSGFFRYNHAKVSRVQTKAFLDVNEAGSEAAAASFYKLVPLSLPAKVVSFTVDHPFMFAIRSANSVFFLGHVVKM